MKYLAFDIEAANGYKMYSICSIGVVISDENFNILEKTNIWINPKTVYNLNGTRRNVGIDLHLDKALLDSSPIFPEVYPKLRGLLCGDDYLVIGHAVDSDVRMLNAACKRYRLPSLDFRFLCTQLLYRLYKGEKDVRALSKIAAELNIAYHEHNSEDDAWMSLKTLEFLTRDSGLSVMQLVDKYRVRLGSNNNFELVRPITVEGQVSRKHVSQEAADKIKKFAQQQKVVGKSRKNCVFCLARSLEISDSPTLYRVVQELVADGARYTTRLSKCNLYVANDYPTEQDLMREKRVDELQASGLVETKTIGEILGDDFMKNSDKENKNFIAKSTAEQAAFEFLKRHGQTSSDVEKTADGQSNIQHFIDEAAKGLRVSDGILPMIPTYLCNVDRSKISGGKRILIDAGGTNFRSALGWFDSDGQIHVDKLRKTVMPASDGTELSKEEFYNKIAENISYLASDGCDIGFCFSYPVNMAADMDGEVLGFSKEVRAPEVVGTRVGAETLSALRRYSDKNRGIVILNDTVATLLGGMAMSRKPYSTYLGYIYGTGTNVCCVVDTDKITKAGSLPRGKMLVNTECGGYDGFVRGDFDKIAISKTAFPSRQLFEKMTSGKYLSDIIFEGLITARQEEEISSSAEIVPFVLKDVSEFLSDGGGKFAEMFTEEADRAFVAAMCNELIARAAKMGATVNAALAIATATDKSLPVAVVAEGTTFRKLVGYRERFEEYLAQILSANGLTYEILGGDDLNLIGTLMATMVL